MERAFKFIARVVYVLVAVGTAYGLGLLFEHFREGWGSIGWAVGFFVGLGLAVVVMGRWGSRLDKKEREQVKLILYQKVTEKPGISHAALCRSVEGRHQVTESIRELLREKQIKRERKSRVRRYFPQSSSN